VSNSVVRAILQGCAHLQYIALDRCRRLTDSAFDFSDSPFQPLIGCLSLEWISLQGCPQITGELVQSLNKHCRTLTHLNLSQCKQLRGSQLYPLLNHHGLKELNLAFIDDISDEIFLPATPSALDSTNNSNTYVGKYSPLQILNLCRAKITDSSMQEMARLRDLLEIRLQWCAHITDVGVVVLVQACHKLQVIDLKSCAVTDQAVTAIGTQCFDLRELDLSWCFLISDIGLRALAPQIEDGARNNLKKLSLVWCPQITDSSIDVICSIDTLEVVQLAGCSGISAEGIQSLTSHGIQVIS
jgi:hypothetical protein